MNFKQLNEQLQKFIIQEIDNKLSKNWTKEHLITLIKNVKNDLEKNTNRSVDYKIYDTWSEINIGKVWDNERELLPNGFELLLYANNGWLKVQIEATNSYSKLRGVTETYILDEFTPKKLEKTVIKVVRDALNSLQKEGQEIDKAQSNISSLLDKVKTLISKHKTDKLTNAEVKSTIKSYNYYGFSRVICLDSFVSVSGSTRILAVALTSKQELTCVVEFIGDSWLFIREFSEFDLQPKDKIRILKQIIEQL